MNFRTYLKSLSLSGRSVKVYSRALKPFLRWVGQQHLSTGEVKYGDLIRYLTEQKSQGKNKHHLRHQLQALRHYYSWQINEGLLTDNPAAGLYLRGIRRRAPHDLPEPEDRIRLYREYPADDAAGNRNKVITGLMVFQGLLAEDLERLKPEHLKLKQGKILVPGSRKSNSRVLKLEPEQILEMQQYLEQSRPRLLRHHRIEDPEKITTLFVSSTGTGKLGNLLHRIYKTLRAQHPGLVRKYKTITGKQIRASVITAWLKTEDIRQVQYMAGHRYVSSTERYLQTGLEDLKEQLSRYHPLR